MVEQTLETQLTESVAKYKAGGDAIDKFINGTDTEVIASSSGNKPTIAKIIKDTKTRINISTGDFNTKAAQVKADKQSVENMKKSIESIQAEISKYSKQRFVLWEGDIHRSLVRAVQMQYDFRNFDFLIIDVYVNTVGGAKLQTFIDVGALIFSAEYGETPHIAIDVFTDGNNDFSYLSICFYEKNTQGGKYPEAMINSSGGHQRYHITKITGIKGGV